MWSITTLTRSRIFLTFKGTVLILILIIAGELSLQAGVIRSKPQKKAEGLVQETATDTEAVPQPIAGPQIKALQNGQVSKKSNTALKNSQVSKKISHRSLVRSEIKLVPRATVENRTISKPIRNKLEKNKRMRVALTEMKGNISKNQENHSSPRKLQEFVQNFNFTIDHPTACGADLGKSLPLLIIVTTAVNKMNNRDAIRGTWGAYAKEIGAKLYFLTGQTPVADVQTYVNDENKFYQDILQANFTDSYHNLTLKSVSLMKWVSERCTNVPYVLKTDDDMLINVDMMMAFVKGKRKFTKSIFGKVAKNWRPHRDRTNKYYVSMQEYNRTKYPDFTTGPAYIFTGDCARLIYESSLQHPFLFLEDVLLTGIVAEEVGIKRWHHVKMKNIWVKVTYCLFKTVMTTHKHSPEDIELLWDEVSRTDVNCTAERLKLKPKKKVK